MLHTFQLHNYAHELGYSLEKGVCQALISFINTYPLLVASCKCIVPNVPQLLVNADWLVSHPQVSAERVQHFAAHVIMHSCVVREHNSGRKRVIIGDVKLLLAFFRGMCSQ